MKICKSSLELIGNTPMLLVKNIDTGPCNLYLKLESFNLGGSIKDRPARNMIQEAEKKGYLKQIAINSNQTYFDTNTSEHHHFYDLKEEKLIDLKNSDVGPINILKKIDGKKIKSVEVLVKLED